MRKLFLGLCGWLMVCSVSAQTNFVKFGRYEAHPTRILARYAGGEVAPQSSKATLQNLGLHEARKYRQIPGLVMLDVAKPVALAFAGEPKTQRDQLVARIQALKDSGMFAYVEPDYVVRHQAVPSDAKFTDGTLWGLYNYGQKGGVAGADINATNAWSLTTGSTNVVVAVIDTGIRYTHQDLATNMWHNFSELDSNGKDDDQDGYVDNIFGVNAVTGSGDPFDDNNHGTHVAGTIGAVANDGHPHVGVNWTVRLMACKFLHAEGFGFTSDAITCIDFAVSKGVKILSNSWGGGPYEQALFDAIAAARDKGALFIAAAGNEGNDNDANPSYPNSYGLENIISVAALDRRDRLASFSNFGKNSVHLGAPGVEIYSSTAGSDREYSVFAGTSMATPHVSGVAALILARSTNATVAEMRARILSTATPVNSLKDKTTTGGRLNAFRALTATPDGTLEVSVDPPSGGDILAGSQTPMFVRVTDLLPVNNASVAVIPANSNLVAFFNDGRSPDVRSNDNVYSGTLQVPKTPGTFSFDLLITAAGKTSATNTVVYNVLPRPANDDFANAAKVPSAGAFGTTLITATNKFATTETGEPLHGGIASMDASLWWNYSPRANGRILVDTAGSSIDTVIAVYSGASLTSLKKQAAQDDVDGKLQSHLFFDGTNGITYHIAVAGFAKDQVGKIRLRVEPGGQPDTNAPIVAITAPLGGLLVTNAEDAHIVIQGTALDPQPNASGVKEVLVKMNDDIAITAFGTTNWASTNILQIGENTVTVLASDFAGNISQSQVVHVTYRPVALLNDSFAYAFPLLGTSGNVTAVSTNATKEGGEPFHAGNDGGKSVWWSFRPATDGVLTLSTKGSSFDTLLALYSGARVNQLVAIAGNDDVSDGSGYSEIKQAVKGGEVYHIAVDGFAGRSGDVALSYSFKATPVANLTVTSSAGGAVFPGSGLVEANAVVALTAVPDAGFEFAGWEGASSSRDNPLNLIVTADTSIRANFRLTSVSDDFESGGLNALGYATSGNAPWLVQSAIISNGKFAARSGAIGNNQRSSLTLTAQMVAGTAAFDLRVSSEKNWDFLEFYLNGIRQQRWSGEVGWLTYSLLVPAGQNTFEWRYVKDASVSRGLDAAFIDNLQLPKAGVATGASSLKLEMVARPNGVLHLQLHGESGREYVVEASSDLQNWQPVSTNVASGGVIDIVDPKANTVPFRYYRATSR